MCKHPCMQVWQKRRGKKNHNYSGIFFWVCVHTHTYHEVRSNFLEAIRHLWKGVVIRPNASLLYSVLLQLGFGRHQYSLCILCNTLQHTATHYNTLQHTATHCNTLEHTATHCNTLQHTATHCNTLQHTATHCNTLQQTATRCNDTLQHTYNAQDT